MKKLSLIFLIFSALQSLAQTTISGKVLSGDHTPVEGANVYLEGTYSGTTSDANGFFEFNASDEGIQTLVISYLSFETYRLVTEINKMQNLVILLREDVNNLDAVVLSAGTFSAGDNSKVSVLKPLDVVTTASALGDFVGALQTLPGTTTVAEDGRLFVRGGDANETQIFIDGIRVFTPYAPTTNNAPTRGRYSPFLFDGITFSTGGYSAEYGQALSSVLLLNTIDEPDQEKTDIGIMSVGASLGNTQKRDRSSLSFNVSYINLAPYNAIFTSRNNWIKPFETASGESVYRKKTNTGLLKIYGAFDTTQFELTQEDINLEEPAYFKLNNKNLYFNASYKGLINESWSFQTGLSYTNAINRLNIIKSSIRDHENSVHAKLKFKKRFNNRFKLNFGGEYFLTDFKENYADESINNANYGFENNIAATFAEADYFISENLAFKTGIRADYSAIFDRLNLAPRVSMAYKTSKNGQLSLAFGKFYQNPASIILKYDQDLKPENTNHYILNYQYNAQGKIFRVEGYYKSYNNLIKYDSDLAVYNSHYTNGGYGFARGVDLFWRDNKSVKNLDYWLSYSFLDTERNYKNYLQPEIPPYANTHNLSIVGKYWINDWRSQVGFTFALASGRTFTNPNLPGILNDKTKGYSNLSINWAYLVSSQKILYASINNVLGSKNINGYQYSNSPDSQGNFNRRALRPSADQFFFVGFFWTISDDKKSNQLDNL
ncbi:TonB-dependent receptor [Gaetbulibacter aestuarii]|uniref:TonB-dependent receptor n=1 Tax=Gaetbulibacter aestuarii TaxID=1502358 RepID=A0ABW7MXK7_9FLAO